MWIQRWTNLVCSCALKVPLWREVWRKGLGLLICINYPLWSTALPNLTPHKKVLLIILRLLLYFIWWLAVYVSICWSHRSRWTHYFMHSLHFYFGLLITARGWQGCVSFAKQGPESCCLAKWLSKWSIISITKTILCYTTISHYLQWAPITHMPLMSKLAYFLVPSLIRLHTAMSNAAPQ